MLLWHLPKMPPRSRPFLVLTFVTLFIGMILAGAANDKVIWGFFAWHATWHIVSAFALMTLWAFNNERFRDHPSGRID